MLGGLLESGDVHVSDAGLDHEVQVDAVARNLVADDGKLQRIFGTFAEHRDADGRALGPLEQIGYVRGAHVVGGLAVDGGDDVAGADARAISRSSDERRDDDNLIIARADRHAYAVIFAALFFAQRRIGLGVEEIRVRIELVQHARDGAVIDRLVGIHRVGVVLLDGLIDLGELLQAVADVGVAAGCGSPDLCAERRAFRAGRTERERKLPGRENGSWNDENCQPCFENLEARTWRDQPPHLTQYSMQERLFSWMQVSGWGYIGARFLGE